MSESCLISPDEKSVGTVIEVVESLIKKFPGSEREEPRLVAIRITGVHAADVYLYGPTDEDDDKKEESEDDDDIDNPEIAASPVTTFNIIGDDDQIITDFLSQKYGVEDLPL